MNFYSFFSLLSAMFSLFLGYLVFRKNSQKSLNIVFFVFTFLIALWLSGSSMLLSNCRNEGLSLMLERITYFGVIFMPPAFFHFNVLLTAEKKRNFLVIIGYLISIVFFVLSLTDKFIHDFNYYSWGCHTKAGIYHTYFLVYFAIFVIFSFLHLIGAIKKASGVKRTQLSYLLVAFAVLCVGGLGFLPAYGIDIPPFMYVSGLITVVIIAYAIVKHRLMDIRVVLRQYLVYILSLALSIIPLVIVKEIIDISFPVIEKLSDYVLIIFVIYIYPKVQTRLYNLSNKYFFSSLYDDRVLIAELSDKLSSTLRVRRLYYFVMSVLHKAFHTNGMAFMVYKKKDNILEINYRKGMRRVSPKFFEVDQDCMKLLTKDNRPIVISDLKKNEYVRYKNFIDVMRGWKMEVVVPLIIRNKLIGVLILSNKESKDLYNDTDLRVLEIISAQAALAINNALSYEEIRNFSSKLEHEVDDATRELRDANQKLKQLDEAKSEFVSIASHQLRTPLTVIKGYISMILEGSFGRVPVKQRESLVRVADSNERLIQLVENLLNISRIESGRLRFDFEYVQIEDMVVSVVEELSGQAKKKGIKLEYDIPSKSLPRLMLDREKIRQVVMNLVDNAVKYTNEGSVKIKLSKRNEEVIFSVEDRGMGISAEDLPKLFTKFTRGTDTPLVHTEGTGLGLYVARQMIEVHHGKVWAESAGTGLGSRFCFTLPVHWQKKSYVLKAKK